MSCIAKIFQTEIFKYIGYCETQMDKRGIVTHPVGLFVIGLVIGFVLVILWAKGIINVPFPFCK